MLRGKNTKKGHSVKRTFNLEKKILLSVKTMKTGTDYLVIKIPKSILKKLPEGYFFIDLEIKKVRGGKLTK